MNQNMDRGQIYVTKGCKFTTDTPAKDYRNPSLHGYVPIILLIEANFGMYE